ncbi:c-type cytochrome [Halomonas sp. B23F22_10]|uniref:c-type cytochrome n=1 Tax=Halomonas sp. B23F22_10 TaxID=3459515 RepID=UPI00373F0796
METSVFSLRRRLVPGGLALLLAMLAGQAEAADGVSQASLSRGEYLARAADCAACHTPPDHEEDAFGGGYVIASPLGDIVSSNITPSEQFGIGGWSEAEFARAVREGVTPAGTHLYPAMPYDAYSGITDEDMRALYGYFMDGVAPIDRAPRRHTDLAFPFNQRWLMAAWNLLFTDDERFAVREGESHVLARGRYLVDNLAHCGTCHTPRNVFMAPEEDEYLAGAPLGGWYAPNITADETNGIGGWRDQELVDYLKNGHVTGKGVAAGPMAEAVENSFRFLDDDDLHAMADYLKSVPAVAGSTHTPPQEGGGDASGEPYAFQDDSADKTKRAVRQARRALPEVMADRSDFAGMTDGALLYESSCASCHQLNGAGTEDHYYPSLYHSSATAASSPNNLVMTVLKGIDRRGADGEIAMPAFGRDYSDEQVAAVVNFVADRFGNPALDVTAQRVATLRAGGDKPLLATLGGWLVAIPVVAVVVLLAMVRWRRRRRRTAALARR